MTRHTHLNFTVGSALALISLSACQTSSPTAEVASPATLPFPATSVPTLTPSPSLPPPTSTTLPPSPKPPLTTGSIVNGNFETGDLTGWQVEDGPRGEGGMPPWGSGWWLVYEDGAIPPDPSFENQYHPWEFIDPPQGNYAAVSSGATPGRRVLFQDVLLDAPYELHFTFLYFNLAHIFDSPRHFRWDGQNNTQFRVDLMDPTAPLLSLDDGDVLAEIFGTREGDPPVLGATPITFDLSDWVGRAVRIRFVAVQNVDPFLVGLDDIRLEPIEA